MAARLLGLEGFGLTSATDYGGELELLVETTETMTGCPTCGVIATPHAWRAHLARDIPASGRPVALVWNKRVWRCGQPLCGKRTWSETHPAIEARPL